MSLEINGKYEVRARRSGSKWLRVNCPGCAETIHFALDGKQFQRRTCRRCRSVFRGQLTRDNPPTDMTLVCLALGRGQAGASAEDVRDASQKAAEAALESSMTEVREALTKELTEVAQQAAVAAARQVAPVELTINLAGKKKAKKVAGRQHACFAELLEVLHTIGQALLVGPAGTGKTTLGQQVADALGLRFGYLSCTEGVSEAHLLGRMNIEGKYIPSTFIELFEKGGVFLFDEVDAADPNTMLVINGALANGMVSVPNRPGKPIAKRHEDFYIVCAANTYGTGAGTEYAGRNTLDAAFLDRFVMATMEVGYDSVLERELAGQGLAPLLDVLWQVRKNVQDARIRRPVSARALINGARLHAVNPERYTLKVLLDRFFTGWSSQEREKALHGVRLAALDGDASGSATPSDSDGEAGATVPTCPNCNGPMVKRRAVRGSRQGLKFWGCRGFPRCNGTRDIG